MENHRSIEQVVVLTRNVQPEDPPDHIAFMLAEFRKLYPHATVQRKEMPKPEGIAHPDAFIVYYGWSGWSFFW